MRSQNRWLVTGILVVACLLVALVMGGCAGGTSSDIPEPPSTLAKETTETSLYYSTGRSLLEERRVVDATDPYTAILTELLAANPENNSDVAIVQPVAEFNSVTLEGDQIVVDWKPAILDFEATDSEKRLALGAFLATFGEFSNVKTVKFTVDGKTEGEVEGKEIADFWGAVSLKNQPWDVLRVQHLQSGESTESATQPGEDSTETGE